MNRINVSELMREVVSWIDATPTQRLRFTDHLEKCFYDYDALAQAWAWYLKGWER